MKKLNLGCGKDIRQNDGWINIDIRPGPGVNLVHDLGFPLPFSEGEVDEILAQDVLEHFPIAMTQTLLRDWRRVLKVGGVAVIEVPDIKAQAAQWLRGQVAGARPDQHIDARFSEIVYGKQDYPENTHYQLFTEDRFKIELHAAGFIGWTFYSRGRALGVKAVK